LKSWVNARLGRFNVQLTTLTARRREQQRIEALADSGYFDHPVFPIPPALASMDPAPLLVALQEYLPRYADFTNEGTNDVGYRLDNDFFSSPDAEVLYAMVRFHRPRRIVEVGSGNSTRVSRQAIIDGSLNTHLTCVDPSPRADVSRCADVVFLQPAEHLLEHDVFRSLHAGDILFIDSSHELRPGNDCVALFLRVLPALPPGVLLHIHDVFLPYDYPRWFLVHEALALSTEQYLVQAMLMAGADFDVLWASHYLLRSDQRLTKILPKASLRGGTSLWLRKQ
jgi:hypothetical protein